MGWMWAVAVLVVLIGAGMLIDLAGIAGCRSRRS
jgi:hypothetical protein